MSKELHHLAQGKEGVTVGTNTTFYLTHDKIRRIPKDRRQKRGTIVGDRMTEKGRGGGDLVETFELHEITSLPYFRAPRSSERTGTYSACILGVRLRCQRHDQLVFRAQSEG